MFRRSASATRPRTSTIAASPPITGCARRFKPILWLHGHTSLAATDCWHVRWGGTTLVNVTGAVLLELRPTAGPPPDIGQ